jgi:FlaA1/EpsC-like NDP-sugar epimerase
VRIADIARRLADEADRRVEIQYTGLRPGEKLHEVLLGDNEVTEPSAHELISKVTVPPIAHDVIDRLPVGLADAATMALLASLSSGPATSAVDNH